jgi:hypothetical protein
MLIDALNPALQDRKVAFDGVGVDLAANVLFRAVDNGSVRSEVPADAGIDGRLVGHEAAVHMGVPCEDGPQELCGDIWDVKAADLAAALDKRHDGLLGCWGLIGAAAGLPTDIGFIGLDSLTGAPERRGKQAPIFLHGFADAVPGEPCGGAS